MSGNRNNATLESSLVRRLMEAEETLAAIHHGEVDAVVVDGAAGQQVYCLESPDQPFRIFVERMQEGALTVSGDGTITYCNPFFAELVECPIEQVRGQALAEFIAPGQQQALLDMLQTAANEIVHDESLLRSANGRLVPVQLALNRLPAEHLRSFGVVVTDLTQRDLAKQLEIQRRAAEEAKLARDRFLAIVSHELRAPLSAILGWAQVLQRRDDLPELAQRGLEVIVRNAWSQSHLIEDLLDVSRILAGKLRLDPKPTDLAAIIRAAVSSAQPSAEAGHVAVEVTLPAAALRVRGDANRLQQIVSNLLSNAIKFSPPNGVVHVELREVRQRAEIIVTDAGAGIAPEHLPSVFDLYRQIENTTRDSGGLGLGLAIVKQLAELHGGEVDAQSSGEGQGSTFSVRLPLLDDDPEGADADTGEPPGAATLAGLRLLVVEDQQDERDALVHEFAASGAEVVAVASAAEALAVLERQPADLLLSDIGLPDMNGYELIRRIRAKGLSGRDLPAIAITAFAGREDRREALVAGFQMHVPKPLDQDELHAAVANLVESARGGEGNTT